MTETKFQVDDVVRFKHPTSKHNLKLIRCLTGNHRIAEIKRFEDDDCLFAYIPTVDWVDQNLTDDNRVWCNFDEIELVENVNVVE